MSTDRLLYKLVVTGVCWGETLRLPRQTDSSQWPIRGREVSIPKGDAHTASDTQAMDRVDPGPTHTLTHTQTKCKLIELKINKCNQSDTSPHHDGDG